jgi:hypothetical protein
VPLKLYQMQILAGTMLIILVECVLFVVRPRLNDSLVDLIEGAGFVLCCVGVADGGRRVRIAFEAFGRDKSVAKRDQVFMRTRAQVQLAALAAKIAVGLAVARRFGFTPIVPLLGGGLLGLSLPFVNRATGWSK